MTWDDYKAKVDEWLKANGYSGDVQLDYLKFMRDDKTFNMYLNMYVEERDGGLVVWCSP